jgi:hypothetical protein
MNPGTFVHLFNLTDYCVKINTEGFTEADSLVQPSGGNCCNWVLGHIVASRNGILRLLGESPIWSDQEIELYKRGSAAIKAGSAACSHEKMLADFQRSQEQIQSALKRMSPEDLSRVDGDGTVGQKLATLHFHEAYHVGQLGLLRRIAGKEGAIS